MDDGIKINRGLRGVYFERSSISSIDGLKGELNYRGYSIDELDAIKYIENVGQKAIDILKTPIDNLEKRELLFEQMLNLL